MDASKKARSAAKGLFTKARNNLYRLIKSSANVEIIENRFTELKINYSKTLEKHAEYVGMLDEKDEEAMKIEEGWIDVIDLEFDDAEANKVKYIYENSNNIKKEEVKQQVLQAEHAKKQFLTMRMVEEASFISMCKNIESCIRSQMEAERPIVEIVKEELSDLKQQLEACKRAHQNYIGTLDEIPTAEIQWIAALQDKVSGISSEIGELVKKREEKVKRASSMRLERIKMPKFDGDIRDYPRFKADFVRQVMPEFQNDSHAAAYVLKSCLSKLPLDTIRNVDDDIKEMWKRLDEKYGKASKLTDAVMNDIKKMRPVREGDNKRFVEIVDTVERGFRDLERLKLEREMSNCTVVSLIEDKLPRDVRRFWALEVSKVNSKVKDDDKFPSLLEFLLEQKRAIEYDTQDLRTYGSAFGSAHHFEENNGSAHHFEGNNPVTHLTCVMHQGANHSTRDCRDFLALPPEDKVDTIKKNRMCYSCLEVGHKVIDCRNRRKCNIDGCTRNHHSSLHQGMIDGVNYHTMGDTRNSRGACLLQIMSIKPVNTSVKSLTVFFDGGATISLITFKSAAMLNLNGMEVTVTVTKVGGTQERMKSYQYSLPLLDMQGKIVEFQVYGIDRISEEVRSVNFEGIIHLFTNLKESEVKRPVGEMDVLIGFEYAGFHPVREQSAHHLLLMSNRFGKCIGGSHEMLYEGTRKIVQHVVIHHCQRVDVEQFYKIEEMGVKQSTECSTCNSDNKHDAIRLNHVKGAKIEDFYNIEAMGVDSNPKCGSCKCGKCPIGGKSYTLKEEREMRLIEEGLQHVGDHWIARYPWRRNPSDLPDNRSPAITMLKSLERRLLKNPDHAKVYQLQIEDMLSRGVARKLSRKEIEEYKGPTFYISHHEIVKPGNASTPCRIVFNSSAKFNNHVLNDYWVKGPDMINNLLGILVRFREGKVAITGDIKKMYHAVKITELDQHTHRFLWRDMILDKEPDTYIMTVVSFGDKPAGNIAITALRKTAEMGKNTYPEAAEVILRNTYVDDIVDSFDDQEKADKVKKEIDDLIKVGGFKVKQWSSSFNIFVSQGALKVEEGTSKETMYNGKLKQKSEAEQEETQKILGLRWNPEEDIFTFDIHLNFSPKVRNLRTGPDISEEFLRSDTPIVLTKRMILSQINSIYDPLGLVSPFTVRAKILMRKLWSGECKLLGWDDPVPQDNLKEWIMFFRELFEMNGISFKRCLKPDDSVGDPSIIIFSDGSDDAYGACAFVRWQKLDGSFESKLIASKNRVTPLRRMTTVRSELCGAVLAKRLKVFIEAETRFQFTKEYFIVDSQIVRGMIQRESYGFNTFVAVRIGEIQEATNPKDWYWVDGKYNVADWLTRGKTPKELKEDSTWQKGAEFLKLAESEWPLQRQCVEELSEQIKAVMSFMADVKETLASRINITRFSEYNKLIRVTARILAMYSKDPKPSFSNATRGISPQDFQNAETFWHLDAQKIIKEQIRKGELKRFHPKVQADGVVVVGGRAEKWLKINYDNDMLILLPYKHRLSLLYAEYVHREEGHLGVLATASKIRERAWITNLITMVRSIRRRCVPCRRKGKVEQQIMAPLPVDRLKPSPAWYATSLDLFGPMEVKGEVNKRSRGKVYGVLFNCLTSRAVHVDIAPDYTTEGFLMVLRRFVSLRGYPAKLFSDPGSQLVSASKELKHVIKGLDRDQLVKFGVEKGLEWKFSPADGPWQNGCAESLVKSVKKAIVGAIGTQILTVAQMQTVCFEAANLVMRHPLDGIPLILMMECI